MGKYLDILARSGVCDKSDQSDTSPLLVVPADQPPHFGRFCRFGRTVSALENRCPDLVPIDRCYELVGLLRVAWRGFDGGQEARALLDAFFADLGRRAAVH